MIETLTEPEGSTSKWIWFPFLMLFASFACVFLTMWNTDRADWPTENSVIWVIGFSLAILFPVIVCHLHAIFLFRRISWLTWWFCISNIVVLGFWIYALIRPAEFNLEEPLVSSWFFSCCIGGPLGGFLVFGIMKKFVPHWIGLKQANSRHVQRKLSLRTMFYWLTSFGILLGAMVNPQVFNFVDDERLVPFPFWLVIAALAVALFCLFVFPVVLGWLRNAKPFWQAAIALVTFSFMIPVVFFAWLTIDRMASHVSVFEGSINTTVLMTYMSVFAIVWYAICSQAGLITEADPSKSKLRSLLNRVLSPMGRGIRYMGVALAGLMVVFMVGWSYVHFLSGGPERNAELVGRAFLESLPGKNVEMDLEERVNLLRSKDVRPADNMALQILKIVKPQVGPELKESTLYKFAESLGMSPAELDRIPSINFCDEALESHTAYRESLEKALPDEPSYEFLVDESEETDNIRLLRQMSEEQKKEVFAEYMSGWWDPDERLLINAPWTDEEYPPGAEFLARHHDKILAIRKAAGCSSYFCPFVSVGRKTFETPKGKLFKAPGFLLTANGFRNVGNGNIEEAMLDCEALWKLASHSTNDQDSKLERDVSFNLASLAGRLNLAIVCSDELSKDQIMILNAKQRVALKLLAQESWYELDFQSQKTTFVQEMVQRPEVSLLGREIFEFDGIFGVYQRHPEFIDWQVFESEFDKLAIQIQRANRQAVLGEIGCNELETQRLAVVAGVSPNRRTFTHAYYSSFGNQLITLFQGPKTKGKMLGQSAFSFLQRFRIPSYHFRSLRILNETGAAIETYRQVHSQYPESLEQLVPEFLEEIRTDPCSNDGSSFTYVPAKGSAPNHNEFVLYSTGHDGVDDGGDLFDDLVYIQRPRNLLEYLVGENF